MTIATGRFDIHRWLPPQVRDAVSAVCQRRRYGPGQIVYLQDDAGEEMFRLIEGAVRLSVMRDDGRELLYLLFEPGDCFGASSLVDGGPRPHTAEAQSEVVVEVIGRNAFAGLRARHREFDDALLRLLSGHMRLLSGYVADATLDELPSRLANRLLAAARSDGEAQPVVRLAQAELGRMIGASRQTVNKLLQQFQDDGLVGLAYGVVTIVDAAGLKRRATPD